MDERIEAAWRACREAEAGPMRSEKLADTERLVTCLHDAAAVSRRAWTLRIVSESLATRGRVPLRFPLMRGVLQPELERGVMDGEPGAATLLARVWSDSWRACLDHSTLPDRLRNPYALLHEALRIDSEDVGASAALLRMLVRDLNYSLHELPLGVLYGHNGATIEDIGDLMESVDELEHHAQRLGDATHVELIVECRFHFAHYRDYLRLPSRGEGYAAYLTSLETRGITPP